MISFTPPPFNSLTSLLDESGAPNHWQRSRLHRCPTVIAVGLALLGGLGACQTDTFNPEDKTSAELPGYTAPGLEPLGQADAPDADALLADALAFRADVDIWREGEVLDSRSAYTPVELAATISNTFNMIWGRPGVEYTRGVVVHDSIAIPSAALGSDDALAVYESVVDIVESTLEDYDPESRNYRFVYVSTSTDATAGDQFHVYVDAGDASPEGLGGRSNSRRWSNDNTEGCLNTLGADQYIENEQRDLLNNNVNVNANGQASTGSTNGGKRKRVSVSGSVAVGVNASPQDGYAIGADLVLNTLSFDRDNFSNDGDFSNDFQDDIPAEPGNFPDEGQYYIHYGGFTGDELCFSGQKAQQYVNDHTFLGEGYIKWRWKDARNIPQSNNDYIRVGTYSESVLTNVSPTFEPREHVTKFFYGISLESQSPFNPQPF